MCMSLSADDFFINLVKIAVALVIQTNTVFGEVLDGISQLTVLVPAL